MMKKLTALLIIILLSASSIFANGKIIEAEIKTKISCDHCKLCESCGKRIEDALYARKGIKRVDIDDRQMIIKVAYNENKVSLADIKHTIASNGYDADDIKATTESFQKLDACCKGEE